MSRANKRANNEASRFAVVDSETATAALTVNAAASAEANSVLTDDDTGWLLVRNPSAAVVYWSTDDAAGADGMPVAASGGAEDIPVKGGTRIYFHVDSGTNKIHLAELKA